MSDQGIRCGRLLVRVLHGSITGLTKRHELIVSSDDTHLSHGGGVSRAIWESAGPDLGEFVERERPRLQVGSVFRTPAGRLNADGVLHAITIDFDNYRSIRAAEAQDLYAAVLDRAAADGAASLALPLLGGGAADLGEGPSVSALAGALEDRVDEADSLQEITLVVVSAEKAHVFRGLLAAHLAKVVTLQHLAERAGHQAQPAITGGDPDEGALWAAVLCQEWVARTSLDRSSATLSAAVAASNRVVHGMIVTAADRRACLREIKAALAALLAADRTGHANSLLSYRRWRTDEAEHVHTEAFAQGATWDCVMNLAPAVSRRAAPSRRHEPATGTTVSNGTAHVRRLHEFLLRTLPDDALAAIEQRLRDEGYKGSRDSCLLECCVRVDPGQLLNDWLNPAQLAKALAERGVTVTHGTSTPQLIARLLRVLGFPGSEAPLSLTAIRARLLSNKSQVPYADLVSLRGMVNEAGAALEYSCRMLVHFLCRRVFQESSDAFLKRTGLIETSGEQDAFSLGKWLTALERLGREIRDSELPAAVQFKETSGNSGLLPRKSARLAGARNEFAHYREWLGNESLTEVRARAIRFHESALELLAHWTHPGRDLVPTLVRVHEIRIDRWGRRVVLAHDPDGQVEYIFSDLDVNPGEVYLMHSFTNPFRVDPILVPVGDLRSSAAAGT